ncbi:MAG: CDP-glucose 4,6-dehydratase [Polyangiaceae bacterium]
MAGNLATKLSEFYRNRRVLVTGHTGFKGSWLSLWLHRMGAEVFGIGLPPNSPLSLYSACGLEKLMRSEFIDIRDLTALEKSITDFRPEVVIHLAAQAIVGVSYEDPVGTMSTNVLGTVHVLECVRRTPSVTAAVMITSDKAYENIEQIWGYRETDRLGGDDPYSASKGCAELAIKTYARSYFSKDGTPSVASTRAGNVVGGGDFSRFRLVPDCIRSLRANEPIVIRNPAATRPWQFVLDPLAGYLILGRKLVERGKQFAGSFNFGPPGDNTNNVEQGTREIMSAWGGGEMRVTPSDLFHENKLLQLDSTKAREVLRWRTLLDFSSTMRTTAEWYKAQHEMGDGNMLAFSNDQLTQFERRMNAELPDE